MKARNREVKFELACILISFIPEYIWKSENSTFLDPCAQNGSLLRVIVQKLKQYGHSYENIKNRVFGFFEDDYLKNLAINKYDLIGNFGVVDIFKCKVDKTLGITFYINNKKYTMKFDVCSQNPPYKGSLHLKFLELGFDLLTDNGKMLIVNPSSWLVLLREGTTKQKYDILKNKIQKFVKNVEFFHADKWFSDISPYVPLEIMYIDKSIETDNIEFTDLESNKKVITNLNEANLIGNYNTIKSIENKIKQTCFENIKSYIDKGKKYFVNLSSLVGNGSFTIIFYDNIQRTYKNMYNLINNTSNKITNSPVHAKSQSKKKLQGNIKKFVSFNTINEAQNFLYFITKTKLCKYLLITYNIDQHIASTYPYIPWLDWKKEWSDKDIYAYFNFNKNEIKLIEDTIEKFKEL